MWKQGEVTNGSIRAPSPRTNPQTKGIQYMIMCLLFTDGPVRVKMPSDYPCIRILSSSHNALISQSRYYHCTVPVCPAFTEPLRRIDGTALTETAGPVAERRATAGAEAGVRDAAYRVRHWWGAEVPDLPTPPGLSGLDRTGDSAGLSFGDAFSINIHRRHHQLCLLLELEFLT